MSDPSNHKPHPLVQANNRVHDLQGALREWSIAHSTVIAITSAAQSITSNAILGNLSFSEADNLGRALDDEQAAERNVRENLYELARISLEHATLHGMIRTAITPYLTSVRWDGVTFNAMRSKAGRDIRWNTDEHDARIRAKHNLHPRKAIPATCFNCGMIHCECDHIAAVRAER